MLVSHESMCITNETRYHTSNALLNVIRLKLMLKSCTHYWVSTSFTSVHFTKKFIYIYRILSSLLSVRGRVMPQITQFAVGNLHGEETFSRYVLPTTEITPEASQLTGISVHQSPNGSKVTIFWVRLFIPTFPFGRSCMLMGEWSSHSKRWSRNSWSGLLSITCSMWCSWRTTEGSLIFLFWCPRWIKLEWWIPSAHMLWALWTLCPSCRSCFLGEMHIPWATSSRTFCKKILLMPMMLKLMYLRCHPFWPLLVLACQP